MIYQQSVSLPSANTSSVESLWYKFVVNTKFVCLNIVTHDGLPWFVGKEADVVSVSSWILIGPIKNQLFMLLNVWKGFHWEM